jgi:hypothetical protein
VSFPLKKIAAQRYATLEHPGDAFAFDIFSQAGRAVRETALLGGLEPARVLAIGESQSAVFLVTYVNAVDPEARVFDGFLLHGRGGSGASLEGLMSVANVSLAEVAAEVSAGRVSPRLAGSDRIRADVRVPVLTLQSETDVVGLGSLGARQPDSERFRLWEVAGAAHADTYLLVASAHDDGTLAPAALAKLLAPTDEVFGMKMSAPMNAGPQQHYVLQAALAHLARWAAGGAPPPEAARLELASRPGGASPFALDAYGIAQGGVRSPWVDAPSAVLSVRPRTERHGVRVPVRHHAAPRGVRARAALSGRPRGLPRPLPEGHRRGRGGGLPARSGRPRDPRAGGALAARLNEARSDVGA